MFDSVGDFTALSDGKRSRNGDTGVEKRGVGHGMVENFTFLRYLL